jgi:hypothetical protein
MHNKIATKCVIELVSFTTVVEMVAWQPWHIIVTGAGPKKTMMLSSLESKEIEDTLKR